MSRRSSRRQQSINASRRGRGSIRWPTGTAIPVEAARVYSRALYAKAMQKPLLPSVEATLRAAGCLVANSTGDAMQLAHAEAYRTGTAAVLISPDGTMERVTAMVRVTELIDPPRS